MKDALVPQPCLFAVRDAKDAMFLASALSGGAEYLLGPGHMTRELRGKKFVPHLPILPVLVIHLAHDLSLC